MFKTKPSVPRFWSFEFGSLNIVSDFVLRASDFRFLASPQTAEKSQSLNRHDDRKNEGAPLDRVEEVTLQAFLDVRRNLCPVNVRTVFDFVHDLEDEALCLLQNESAVIFENKTS